MGLMILQAPQGAEAVLALLAALWAGLVVWKSIDYIITIRRQRAERERIDPDDGV